MKLAFCLFKYFPYGGLQRDFLRILRICRERGHELHVYTMQWQAELEPGVHVHLIKAKGWQNHSRINHFVSLLHPMLVQAHFDLVIGFNKMPGLDIYYAADVCYQSRIHDTKSQLYRLLPRYRRYRQLEQAVFAQGKATQILLISPLQQKEFQHYYQTEPQRFHLLNPGIDKSRIAPANAQEIRIKKRRQLQISDPTHLMLMVGSGFKTKGLDRAMHALAALPPHIKSQTQFYIIGKDNPVPFQKLAKKLGVAPLVKFLGGRDDVSDLMLAADVLIHPAYHENTGTVLLEAVVAGLPVLTVENCGYAHYICSSRAGIVLSLPYCQQKLNTALGDLLVSEQRLDYGKNGLAFAANANIYDMPQDAADLIENIAS